MMTGTFLQERGYDIVDTASSTALRTSNWIPRCAAASETRIRRCGPYSNVSDGCIARTALGWSTNGTTSA